MRERIVAGAIIAAVAAILIVPNLVGDQTDQGPARPTVTTVDPAKLARVECNGRVMQPIIDQENGIDGRASANRLVDPDEIDLLTRVQLAYIDGDFNSALAVAVEGCKSLVAE